MPRDVLRSRQYSVLDRSLLGHDRVWERELVDSIKRGGAAPHGVSVYDAVSRGGYWAEGLIAHGWEQTEKHSANAIRTNAVFLNDTAIAARQEERARRKAAYKEMLKANREAAEADRPRREAEKAAREEAARDYWYRVQAREKERAEQERLWEENRETRRKLEEQRQAAWEAAAPARRREAERLSILASKWVCTECSGNAILVSEDAGYRLTCLKCGKSAWGSHETIMKVRAT